jgi:magnesium transporter
VEVLGTVVCQQPTLVATSTSRVVDVKIVNNRRYVDGRVAQEFATLHETVRGIADGEGFVWVGLLEPDHESLEFLAHELGLNDLAVDDTKNRNQRAKFDHYGATSLTVLKPGRFIAEREKDRANFGELHIYTGPNFVITCRWTEWPFLGQLRDRLESTQVELLRAGPLGVLYAIIDFVVDGYPEILDGLQDKVEDVEVDLFSDRARRMSGALTKSIFVLLEDVAEFQRTTRPLPQVIDAIMRDLVQHPELAQLAPRFADVKDHCERNWDFADSQRQTLQSAFNVHSAVLSAQQNLEVQRISAWGAIFFVPTIIGAIYGMNFTHMPERDWYWGYPMSLGVMVAICGVLYRMFKKRGWL